MTVYVSVAGLPVYNVNLVNYLYSVFDSYTDVMLEITIIIQATLIPYIMMILMMTMIFAILWSAYWQNKGV